MTEKIIIDGVNVAGCKFIVNRFTENHDYCCKRYGTLLKCINDKNCYYKQLKRLEQENKELKEMLSKEPKAMQAFQISYSGLKRDNEVLWGMIKDYKSALEEINITVKQLLQGVSSNCINNTPYLTALSLIETKTNEVLNHEA